MELWIKMEQQYLAVSVMDSLPSLSSWSCIWIISRSDDGSEGRSIQVWFFFCQSNTNGRRVVGHRRSLLCEHFCLSWIVIQFPWSFKPIEEGYNFCFLWWTRNWSRKVNELAPFAALFWHMIS
jgi:hypothetical protein